MLKSLEISLQTSLLETTSTVSLIPKGGNVKGRDKRERGPVSSPSVGCEPATESLTKDTERKEGGKSSSSPSLGGPSVKSFVSVCFLAYSFES